MRNNKVLATAMTTALAGALSAGGVNAGAISVFYPADPDTNIDNKVVTSPMYVASEDITPGGTLPNTTTGCSDPDSIVKVTYLTSSDLLENTEVRFTLLEGAEVGDAVLLTPGNSTGSTGPSDISPSTLTISQSNGSATIGLISGGEGESTMAFRIQDPVSTGSTLTFSFCIGSADILQEQNQGINLNIEFFDENDSPISAETTSPASVLLSKYGSDGVVNAGVDDGDVKVNIGAEGGAKKFTGSSFDPNQDQLTAILGQVCLRGIGDLYEGDLKTSPWSLADDSTVAGTFTITDAPFNASIGHTVPTDTADPDQLAEVMVFLDVDGTNTVGDSTAADGDIYATSVDTTNASFTLTNADVQKIITASGNSNVKNFDTDKEGCVAIVFKASGNDEIKTLDIAPTGKLTLQFNNKVERIISGKLNHIQRSGTVCVLYNIPGPNSIENANIRVTNKSATPDGTLIGTLRLPDGTDIFTDYDILTATGLGLIGSNQTIYFNTDMLNTIAQSASNPNGAWTDGWKRAILRLETNLDTVEMMALIRDDDVLGAPLMNMSTGASGNGCGR